MNNSMSFKDFLLKDRWNKRWLWIAAAAVVQFSVFKYFYPFASYIHGDSFAYLDTAYRNMTVNTYMVGYSMFLRAFSVFTTSDTILVYFQYFLIQASALYLLFTIFYFYHPGKVARWILLGFIVLNPLFLCLGNMISSDAFFLALSLIWVTLLLWIIQRPTFTAIICHTFVLYIAFTVRYNGLIYFLISLVAFGMSSLPLRAKIWSAAASALLIGLFVLHTGNKYKEITNTWQYSPFAGWQWANNAMYAYRYVDSAHRKPVPEKFKALDNMIRQYFDTTRDLKKNPQEALLASTVYMWSPGLPLFKYRDSVFKKDTSAYELKKWASMGPFYQEYGLYIIKKYPEYFLRYFIWPNGLKYYAPPVEFLSNFNSGKDSVAPIAQSWFRYPSRKITTRTKTLDIKLLDFYPILSGVINVMMLFGLLSFIYLGGPGMDSAFQKGILLGATVWVLNAGFTIGASSAALRYQSFPIILTTIFTTLLLDRLWALATIPTPIKPNTQPRIAI